VTEVPKEELLDCYANWEPEVESLLNVPLISSHSSLFYIEALFQCITHPTRWAIHQLKCLPNYVNGRVALLGDAVSIDLSDT
jgi:salicylate hydroxylase